MRKAIFGIMYLKKEIIPNIKLYLVLSLLVILKLVHEMIGRKEEIRRVSALLDSKKSSFLAVTGRRRVGKTFLIDTLLKEHYCFSMTGIQKGSITVQLTNFAIKLSEYDGSYQPRTPENWQMAFLYLKAYLKDLDSSKKRVIFIDELPWVYTARSNFIQLLAHFWNDYLSKEQHFILVICGSATSWITKRIINDSGGLHNRVTEKIHLHPFTLAESNAFLVAKGLRLTQQEVTKIYMTLGGIPFYLDGLKKGESFAMAIERLCFTSNGLLHNEYHNLYQALFTNAELHQAIVTALAKYHSGITRQQILKELKMKNTGSFQRAIEELLLSDFIMEHNSFGKKKKGLLYRLSDEYSIFYHRFIRPNLKPTPGIWQQLAQSQAYKIWSGLAFETLCMKHVKEIKSALGISGVYTEIAGLTIAGSKENPGFQIDLIIDRKDNTINLCEMKFHSAVFSIQKKYYQQLLEKRQRFTDYTGTKKQVFLTLITNHGVQKNTYANEIVEAEVTLDDLLKET